MEMALPCSATALSRRARVEGKTCVCSFSDRFSRFISITREDQKKTRPQGTRAGEKPSAYYGRRSNALVRGKSCGSQNLAVLGEDRRISLQLSASPPVDKKLLVLWDTGLFPTVDGLSAANAQLPGRVSRRPEGVNQIAISHQGRLCP
jgi:hypothetical protein